MNLIRLLLIGAAIWWVLRFLKNWNIRIERRDQSPVAPPSAAPEPLVLRSCSGCGVRVPVGELGDGERCERCRSAPPRK